MFFFRLTLAGTNTELSTGSIQGEILIREYGKIFWKFPLHFYLHEQSEIQAEYNINNFAVSGSFYIPSQKQTMNTVFHSCNGFSLGVNPDEFKGDLWKDVLRHHGSQHFHVMLGGGDQIYCDMVKEKCPPIKTWTQEKNAKRKKEMPFLPHDRQLTEMFFLNHYIEWFGQGWWEGPLGRCLKPDFPRALASIPSINIFDDHDIIDGFGSYVEETMNSPVFSGIGQVGYKYYMLFQHHTHPGEDPRAEPSWILNPKPGPYMKQQSRSIYARLGKSLAFVGLDCRTERTLEQIVYPETYDAVFQRAQQELRADSQIKHLLLMVGVPIAYPRLVWLESLLQSSAVAPLKSLSKHGVAMGGFVNSFDGAVEILDDLNDHWCAKVHKKERNYLVQRLQKLAEESSVRITILAGDVHLAAMGRFYSSKKSGWYPEVDYRLMLNVVSSAITNTPPASTMADFLNKRNKIHHMDANTEEDMVKLFKFDVNGDTRNNQTLLPRRNWCSIVEITERSPRYLNNKGEPGMIKGPTEIEGPVDPDRTNNDTQFSKYPDKVGALSVVLHVEKNQANATGETRPYEVIAPLLILQKPGNSYQQSQYSYQQQPSYNSNNSNNSHQSQSSFSQQPPPPPLSQSQTFSEWGNIPPPPGPSASNMAALNQNQQSQGFRSSIGSPPSQWGSTPTQQQQQQSTPPPPYNQQQQQYSVSSSSSSSLKNNNNNQQYYPQQNGYFNQ